MRETYRGFVNTWECDENDHVNVQFYFDRFEIAARAAAALSSGRYEAVRLRVRHVRYHKECQAADLLVGESAGVAGRSATVQHRLLNAETGALLATALDLYDGAAWGLSEIPLDPHGAPRGLAEGYDGEARDDAALEAAGYPVTYRGLVRPGEVCAAGAMSDRHFIARVTDAVAHAWTNAGVTGSFLADNGYGRVAVEMKLSIAERPTAGTLLHVRSALIAVTRSTLTFRHLLIDTAARRPFAVVSVAALIMDHRTRRAIRLPDALRATAEATVIPM